jgi:superoxide dismutase, Cu-Zn family
MRIVITVMAALVAAAAIGTAGVIARGGDSKKSEKLRVALRDADGRKIGKVLAVERRRGVALAVNVRRGLEPGWHGFHVHGTGACEGDFTSAGGHLKTGEQTHGDHTGDLPALLVDERGKGTAAFRTDRFTLDDLRDADGSAFIVHAGRDNYANVPERYAPSGPDADTLNTGDAGARAACGIVPGS